MAWSAATESRDERPGLDSGDGGTAFIIFVLPYVPAVFGLTPNGTETRGRHQPQTTLAVRCKGPTQT